MSEDTKNSETEEKSFLRVIVHSFFIIPFLIAVFCVLLVAGVRLLTGERRSVYDYLNDIKVGSLNKRWQGAFELSKILANPKLVPKDEQFANELIQAFQDAKHDDHRVRQYLALAMGRTGRMEFAPVLVHALPTEPEENVTALLYALGMLRLKSTAEAIYPFLENANPRIRSMAVVALGTIANPKAQGFLKKALQDEEPNVQWGAAISLAKMGDPSGKQILLNLMDRTYLAQFPEVDQQEQRYLMLAALNAAGQFDDADLQNKIKELSQTDRSMKIRATALKILHK